MDQLAQTTPYLDFFYKKSSTQDFIRKTLENTRGLCAPSFEFLPEMFRPLLFSNLFNKSLLEFGPNPSTNRVLSLFQFHHRRWKVYEHILYGQLSQGQMTNFPAFIALKSFDLHCKCLQGITGTIQGNRSAGISNLWGLHVYPQSL